MRLPTGQRHATPGPPRPGTSPPRPGTGPPSGVRAVFWAGVALLAARTLVELHALGSGALSLDLGIQHHLSAETARGAVPIIDFEHGWNALSWYAGAALLVLAGGNPSVWAWLWRQVTGYLLAGVTVLAVGWRLRLSAGWLAGLLGAWLVLPQPPNGKYAIPGLWLLAVLPVGRLARGRPALLARALLAGVTVLLHVDLAVMLSVGVAAFDLLGRGDLPLRDRIRLVAALPAGAGLALAGQAGVYWWLGLPPGELFSFLVLDRLRVVPGTTFNYPLLRPAELIQVLYPPSLLLPFVPPVWRRLTDPARLAALLHLSLGLTALRRGDNDHTVVASALLAVLVVLAARDLVRAGRWPLAGRRAAAAVPAAALGVVGFLAGILVAFRTASFLAYPALLAVAGAGVWAARHRDLPWSGLGAAGAAAVLAVAGLGARAAGEVTRPGDTRAEEITAAVRPEVEGCLGGDRRVWVIPHPLRLYTTLEVTNPTPFYLFWPGLAREVPRVRRMVQAGRIPTILQVNTIPPGLRASLGGLVAERYQVCHRQRVATTGDLVTVWRWRGGG